ncbi:MULTISPECIES: transglutaminase family protein [unclassified Adlercreutzia]|uniref:transglutaminase-like domain-containing protein n=1 Tax=unclassified Adlercreutzia TaxID=2636013 RepID=UPI0013EA3837|nr:MULTISPECIES: transglutaminase domain-containing protein [unclassified Adlercreutzia]
MSIASRSDAARERAGAVGGRAGGVTAGLAGGHAGAYASRVLEMLAAALLAAGMVLAVLVAPWPVHVVAAGVFSAVLVTVLLASARPLRVAYGVIAVLAVLALVMLLVMGGSLLRVAGAGLANVFIDAWNAQVDGYVLHFAVTGVPEAAALAFAVFAGLAAGLLAHVICACRLALAAGAVSALLVVAGLFLQTLGAPAFGCLTLGGLVLVSCCSRRADMPPRATLSFAITTTVVTGMVLFVCAGYRGSAGLHAAKEDAVAAVDELRFGSDTLPQGDLAAAHAMNVAPGEQPAERLEVSFADADAVRRSEPLYLRGFAGATYTGTAFERLRPADYEGDWTGLFNWLDARGFDALSQYAAYRALDDAEEGGVAGTSDVTVRALGAYQRYAYAPTSATASGPGALLDLYRTTDRLGGNESSTFEVVTDAQMAEVTAPGGWVYEEAAALDADVDAAAPAEDDLAAREQDFLRSEVAYRSFVRDRYLEVPDAVAPAVEQFFFADDTWDAEDGTLYAASTRIRTMLDVSCDYNGQGVQFAPAGAQPADYVTWFLEDAREGNAAAFASAAVLAFRQVGIPARYVEGYLLDEDALGRMGAASETSCTLDEGDAHAWAEVYVDGAGWMPVEVTPGFYDRVYGSGETVEIAREVAGGGDDDANTGSTGEGAPDWTELLPEELRPFAWIGLVLLCMIELLCVMGVLELQRLARLRLRSARLRRACEHGAASALLFERLERLAADAGVDLGGLKPRERTGALAQARPEVHPSECLRAIALMERERYGQVPLRDFEVRIVESLLEKLEAGNWQRASLPRRLVYRYAALYLIPLARFRAPRA